MQVNTLVALRPQGQQHTPILPELAQRPQIDDRFRNAFLELAERQIVAPLKARERALEKRNRKLEESQRLFRHWQNKRLEQLLAGHHSEAARDLVHFLENMQPADERALIQKIERGPWRQADGDARFTVLHFIDIAIAHVREQQGLPPFDDPLPWLDDEPKPTAFRIIKELLR